MFPSTLENLSVGDIYEWMFSEFPFEQSNKTLGIILVAVGTGQKTVRARSNS